MQVLAAALAAGAAPNLIDLDLRDNPMDSGAEELVVRAGLWWLEKGVVGPSLLLVVLLLLLLLRKIAGTPAYSCPTPSPAYLHFPPYRPRSIHPLITTT